ncbi:unnamed protein product, partial [Musa acuminata subsp. burmannicoides]
FSKKYDGYKDYAKSRFDQFFAHSSRNFIDRSNILAQENLGIMLTILTYLSQENLYKPSRRP